MNFLTRFGLERSRFTIAMMTGLIAFGIALYNNFPKREDPVVVIRTAVVSALFPGMAPNGWKSRCRPDRAQNPGACRSQGHSHVGHGRIAHCLRRLEGRGGKCQCDVAATARQDGRRQTRTARRYTRSTCQQRLRRRRDSDHCDNRRRDFRIAK